MKYSRIHKKKGGRISDLRYHLTISLHSRVHVRKGPPENMPPGNMPPENTPPENMPPGNMPPGNMPPGNMPPAGANMKVFDGFASPR